MTASPDSTRNLVLVFAVAAVATFLMAAAASTIVAQADGPSAREAAFAANSIVVNEVGEPIGSAPQGARVPALIEVSNANLFSSEPLDAPASVEESIKTVLIGISESDAAELVNGFLDHAQLWLPATSDESKRVRSAAIDAGVRLRRLGVSALVLPSGFLTSSAYGCLIADGLHRGGAVPIFRLPSAGRSDTSALRKCLARFSKRNATVFVEHRNDEVPRLVTSPGSQLTMIFDTTQSGLDSSLEAGAAALLVEGESREKTAEGFALTRSKETSEMVMTAAVKMSRWFAEVPPIGTIPSKAAPAERKKKKSVRLRPLEDVSPSRTGNDGRPVAPREPDTPQGGKRESNSNSAPPSANPDSGGAIRQ